MRYYTALVHKDPGSGFGISFPDFSGCVSAGATLDEAVALGREALEGHARLMADRGEPIPEPTAMETILMDPESREGVPVLVPLAPITRNRVVRVNVTLPEAALREIDAYAEAHGYTRSGFLARAARQAMAETG